MPHQPVRFHFNIPDAVISRNKQLKQSEDEPIVHQNKQNPSLKQAFKQSLRRSKYDTIDQSMEQTRLSPSINASFSIESPLTDDSLQSVDRSVALCSDEETEEEDEQSVSEPICPFNLSIHIPADSNETPITMLPTVTKSLYDPAYPWYNQPVNQLKEPADQWEDTETVDQSPSHTITQSIDEWIYRSRINIQSPIGFQPYKDHYQLAKHSEPVQRNVTGYQMINQSISRATNQPSFQTISYSYDSAQQTKYQPVNQSNSQSYFLSQHQHTSLSVNHSPDRPMNHFDKTFAEQNCRRKSSFSALSLWKALIN